MTTTLTQPKTTPKTTSKRPDDLLFRTIEVRKEDIDEGKRTVQLAFSSDTPIERNDFWGEGKYLEVLSHQKRHVRLERINNAHPVLVNHDIHDQVGVIDHATIDTDGKGRAAVRFSRSARGEEIFQDVLDGIRTLVSVGYRVHGTPSVNEKEGELPVRTVEDWEPYEISFVSIPADTTVGVGRSLDSGGDTVGTGARQTETPAEPAQTEQKKMENQDNASPPKAEAQSKVVQIDVGTERADAAQVERKRITEIQAYTERGWLTEDEGAKMISEGASIEDVHRTVLNKPAPKPQLAKEIGLSDRDKERYSFCKAIRQYASKGEVLDGLELEMHQEVDKSVREAGASLQGFGVPLDVMRTRALAATTGTGGEAVATVLESMIEVLEANLVLAELGASKLGNLSSNVQFPRQTARATSAWESEVSSITATDPTLDTLTLSPKRAGIQTKYSKQLVFQMSEDVERWVRNDQGQSLARTVDKGALYGLGTSNEPLGAVTDVLANGNTITFGSPPIILLEYVTLWQEVATANAARGSMKYLTTPLSIAKGLTTFVDTGSGRTIIQGDPASGFTCLGMPVVQVDTLTDGSAVDLVMFGNWSELIWAFFGNGLDVTADMVTAAATAEIIVTTNLFMDSGTRHPLSFNCSTDSGAQ